MVEYNLLWEEMPVGVVSGDETDHHRGRNRYAITKLRWRAPWIREWMATLDRLYLATRFTESGRATPGAFPHVRIMDGRHRPESHDEPVRGLPKNFYDPIWLSEQSAPYIEWLDIRPPINLKFPQELRRLIYFNLHRSLS